MKKYLYPILIVIFGIYFSWYLLRPGLMQTHDGIWHIERIISMAGELKLGQFPVRWSHNLDNGFGMPLFNFAYPGPYYLMGMLHILGLGVVATFNLTTLFFYLLGGFGIYFLFKKTNPFIAFTVSLLYLLAPYQFLDIFVRGALGEVVILGLFPWCLYMISKLESSKHFLWYSSFPLAGVLISHNFLGLILVGYILVASFILYKNKKNILLHLALALGLAAFFLLPMIVERNMLLTPPPSLANADFARHYVYPSQLIYGNWNYEGSLPGNNPNEISYQLGYANIIIILIGLFFTLYTSRVYYFFLAITLFMITNYSDFIWQLFRPLQIIQFSWRLLALATIFISIISFHTLDKLYNKHRKIGITISLLLLVIAALQSLTFKVPVKVLSKEEFSSLHSSYSYKTATAYRYELVPTWAKEERSKSSALSLSSGSAEVSNIEEKEDEISFKAVGSDDHSYVTVYRNYYPSWKAVTKSGTNIELRPAEDGSILVKILEGEHDYKLYVTSTKVEFAGNLISIVSLVIALVILVRSRDAKNKS